MATITTFSAFYRIMEEKCQPSPKKVPALREICDRVWHDGIMNIGLLAREHDASEPTVRKWITIARALGMEPGVTRASTERITPARNKSVDPPAAKPDAGTPVPPAPSESEIRDKLKALHYNDATNATTPEARAKATEALTKIVPNLKVPEVQVSLQAFVGSGANDRLASAIREYFPQLMKDEPGYVMGFLEETGARKFLLEHIEDAEVDGETQAPPVDAPADDDQQDGP